MNYDVVSQNNPYGLFYVHFFTKMTLNSAWKKLLPGIVFETDFEILEPEARIVMKIVSLCRSIVLDMVEDDTIALSKDLYNELTTEELKTLHTQVWRENRCRRRKLCLQVS